MPVAKRFDCLCMCALLRCLWGFYMWRTYLSIPGCPFDSCFILHVHCVNGHIHEEHSRQNKEQTLAISTQRTQSSLQTTQQHRHSHSQWFRKIDTQIKTITTNNTLWGEENTPRDHSFSHSSYETLWHHGNNRLIQPAVLFIPRSRWRSRLLRSLGSDSHFWK